MQYMNKLFGLTLGLVLMGSPAMAYMPHDGGDAPKHMSGEFHKGEMKGHKPDKAEMEKRMAEKKEAFANRLGLTDEQRTKSAALHEQSRAEMKKIMEEMDALKKKADSLREQSKKDFEALLTDDQKKILEQIHQEREAKHKEKAMKNKKFGGKKHHPRHDKEKPAEK